jgi:hypothetical protein
VKNSGKLNDEVDELYQLPLAEFTSARNELAARLKQNGRANDANLVKALQKPPVSAWAVNQLYWNQREEFDTLLSAGKRFHKASLAGKTADLRASLDARREALTQLADLAASVLRDAGHNPSQETIRRITTTLEALSAQASSADGPTLGRLSQDVDPPGFEALAGFLPGAGLMKGAAAPVRTSQKSTANDSQQKAREAREREQTRQARIATAKLALQTAKRSLAEARSAAQNLEGAQKKVLAEAKEAEKRKREAEERFKVASAAYDEAAKRARSVGNEASDAANAVEEAKRRVEDATKELESLFRES